MKLTFHKMFTYCLFPPLLRKSKYSAINIQKKIKSNLETYNILQKKHYP